jgi:hypothetical protein
VVLTCACSGASDAASPPVNAWVDHGAWSLVATPEADPFAAAHARPNVHACESGAYFQPTADTFEVELARCRERYVSLRQPSVRELHAGDSLQFTLSHLLLRPLTESVTEAYLGLTVNARLVWELRLQIAAPSNDYVVSVPITAEFPMGSDVVLHLNNHGENSYTFSPMVVAR